MVGRDFQAQNARRRMPLWVRRNEERGCLCFNVAAVKNVVDKQSGDGQRGQLTVSGRPGQ